jgi:hypothetical protein
MKKARAHKHDVPQEGERYFYQSRRIGVDAWGLRNLIITASVDGPTTVTIGIISGREIDPPLYSYPIDALYGPASSQKQGMVDWFNGRLARSRALFPKRVPVDPGSGKPGDNATFLADALAIAENLQIVRSGTGYQVG